MFPAVHACFAYGIAFAGASRRGRGRGVVAPHGVRVLFVIHVRHRSLRGRGFRTINGVPGVRVPGGARRHRRDCEGGRAAFCHRSQRSVPRCCSRFRRAACDVHLKRIGRPGGMEIARHDVRISHHHVWVLTLIRKQMTLIHWGLTRRPCIPQSSASLFAHTRLTLSCDSLQVCHRVRGFVFLRPRAPTQVGLGEARPGWCW